MYKFNKAIVYKGRANEIAVCFVDENYNSLPTCGISSSSIRIENEDGSFIEKVATQGLAWGLPDKNYLYIYPFTADETNLFKAGVDKSIFLKISFGADCMKYEFKKFLTVLDDVF